MTGNRSYCHDCRRWFISQQALKQHSSSVHPPDYSCPRCNRAFSSSQGLDQHCASVHPKYPCRQCNRAFRSSQGLDQHCASVHPQYPCRQCNRAFHSSQGLDQHCASVHLPDYPCSRCNRVFRSESALDQHLSDAQVHRDPYCKTCQKHFGSEQALHNHLNSSIHHAPVFVHKPTHTCDDCNRNFVSQGALDQHLSSSIHALVTQFHCCECDRDFKNEAALEQHLYDKPHRINRAARAEFFCDKCEREFTDENALRKHLSSLVHNPLIDNVKCISGTACGKRFTSPSAMLHHLESGACTSGMTRRRINQVIMEHDTGSIITSVSSKGRIRESLPPGDDGWNSDSSGGGAPIATPTASTARSIDIGVICLLGGRSCPVCGRAFKTAQGLMAHVASPAHSLKIYHCPLPLAQGKRGMGMFKTLSGLTQHLESGACNGGKDTFRKAMAMVNRKLRELGLADMRLIG